jgi:hypothetical protein
MGARYVLEKPVTDQCVGARLRGCPRITEGILLVVEGNQDAGLDKIREGSAENEPDDFQDFVAAMRLIGKIPGAGQYAEPINQVLALVSAPRQPGKESRRREPRNREVARNAVDTDETTPATEHTAPIRKRRAAVEAAADTSVTAPVDMARVDPKLDLAKWEGETIVPLMHGESRQCTLSSPISAFGEGAKGRCVRVGAGPLVITELHAPGGCTADLFAVAGNISVPRWILYAPTGSALHAVGTFLVVREHEYFVIGETASNESKVKGDVRCSLTWSGYRPSPADPAR